MLLSFLSEYSVSPETNSWIGVIDLWWIKYPDIEMNLLLLFCFAAFKVHYLLSMKLLHVKILLFLTFWLSWQTCFEHFYSSLYNFQELPMLAKF